MYNCIFTPYCMETTCDKACPAYVQTSYLLERNGISFNSPVFKATPQAIKRLNSVLTKFDGTTGGLVVKAPADTMYVSELLTYCAICRNWQGSALHCTVYNLKFAKFLDDTQKSWSLKEAPENLEYARIWSESAKVLIISNFDYVTFNDFACQTILNLIQTRSANGLTTILVSPDPNNLLSNKSVFLSTIKSRWLGTSVESNVEYYDIGGKQA